MFLPFHSADKSDIGMRLRTSSKSRLPWLDSGALSFRVTPAPQVSGIFAPARAGKESNPRRIHNQRLSRSRMQCLARKLRLPAAGAAWPRAAPLFQIVPGRSFRARAEVVKFHDQARVIDCRLFRHLCLPEISELPFYLWRAWNGERAFALGDQVLSGLARS